MALFSVFGSERLEKIDDFLKGADLTAWKNLPSTKSCRRNLLTTMKDGKMTFMDAINRAVWKPEDQSSYNNAYAYAICDAILDPAVLEMRMTEAIITPRLDPDYTPTGLEVESKGNESDEEKSDNEMEMVLCKI